MDAWRVLAGVGLPWLLGVVWLRYRWPRAPEGGWALVVGYGFFIGILVTTLLLRLVDALGLPLSFWLTGTMLTVLTGTGLWLTRSTPWRGWGGRRIEWESRVDQGVFVALAGVLLLHYACLGLELAFRPLDAWDAWATWAPKARAWFELKKLAPFVDWSTWLERGPGEAYTTAAYYYPPMVPLTQTWMSLALGRWDDSLISFPWLGCAVALGLGFYGQARVWGITPLPALVAVYLLLSLPLVNTHVALAGNADIWLAAVYGLSAMAFFQWCRTRDRRQALLALGLAVGCAQVKTPGLVWMLTFVPALVVDRIRISRTLVALAGLLVVGLFLLRVAGPTSALPHVGEVEIAFHPETLGAVVESYFSLATWHLFWYLWVVAFLLAMPRLLDQRLFRTIAALVATDFVFLGVVYGFTSFAEFAVDFTQINRATLHMVPMLTFAALVSVDASVRARETGPA